MEFAPGRIEGVLLLFRAVVNQWAAVGMNRLAKKSLRSNRSQRRRVVQVADKFRAGMFLDFWCQQTMRSRIAPMKKIARTLPAQGELLLNYFKARKQISSGVIEGLNNKAKVTMRRSHRTFRILELALYHSLGKLPEPELTHLVSSYRTGS